jgi:hypothetical protein
VLEGRLSRLWMVMWLTGPVILRALFMILLRDVDVLVERSDYPYQVQCTIRTAPIAAIFCAAQLVGSSSKLHRSEHSFLVAPKVSEPFFCYGHGVSLEQILELPLSLARIG